MTEKTTDSLPTRATLLQRIRNLEDADSWSEFVAIYRRFVYGVACRRGLKPEQAEEVVQEVFFRVAQTIQDFEVRSRPGSFRHWLGKLTRWRVADTWRTPERVVAEALLPREGEEEVSLLEQVPAPEVTEQQFEEEARRHLLQRAFHRMADRISPRQIQAFQMLVLQGESVERVGELLRMNRSAVYVAKHRVAAKLREEVQALRRELK